MKANKDATMTVSEIGEAIGEAATIIDFDRICR
jgi:hypothetical protein